MQNLAKYCRSPFKSQGLDGLVVLCIHQGQSINVQTGPPASPNRPAPNLKVSTKRRRDAQTDIKQSNNVVSFCGVDLFVQFHVSVSQSSFPLAKVLDIKAAKLLSGRLCVRVTTTHLGATFQIQSVQRPKYTKRLQRQSIKDTKSSKTCHIIPLKNIHRLHPLVPMATQKKSMTQGQQATSWVLLAVTSFNWSQVVPVVSQAPWQTAVGTTFRSIHGYRKRMR